MVQQQTGQAYIWDYTLEQQQQSQTNGPLHEEDKEIELWFYKIIKIYSPFFTFFQILRIVFFLKWRDENNTI